MAAMPKCGGDEEGVDKGIVNKGVMDDGGWDEGVGVDMRMWESGHEWCVCEGGGDQGGEIIKRKGSGKRPGETILALFFHSCVRVLGAWLAEESLVLSADVYKLLPFLMKLCEPPTSSQPAEESSFQPVPLSCSTVSSSDWGLADVASSKPYSLLKFLLPGLCHLTAEDRPRRILLEANFQKTLVNYFHTLCSQQCTRYV